MNSPTILILAADAILLLHVLFVAFVVLGLVLIIAGYSLSWRWVRNPWFRILHLVAIGVVVVQVWLGIICPLTVWESKLRLQVGETGYSGSFIAYWLEKLLYYDAPAWVFIALYSVFGVIVAASWYYIRPNRLVKKSKRGGS